MAMAWFRSPSNANTVLKSRGVVFDFSCSFEDSSTLILVFKILVVAVASWATETLSSFVPSHHLSNTATSTTNRISTATIHR